MAGPQPSPPTHYDVLGLTPAMLDDVVASRLHDRRGREPSSSPLVKRAYRRALLRNHPDKAQVAAAAADACSPAPSPSAPRPVARYTVDQISQAFDVLSSPARRSAYDAALGLAHARPGSAPAHFRTGVENVDLDDLPRDADADADRWSRPCRCGDPRGYSFGEADLMDAADDGLLMVGCRGCSLWLVVHFAAVDEAEPGPSENSTT